MKVQEFIDGYKGTTKDKRENFIKERIVVEYIPYEDKIEFCKNIMRACMYDYTANTPIFNRNSAFEFIFYSCGLISSYTDIEFEENETLEIFNMLDREGLLDEVLKAIPQKEMERLEMVRSMITQDEYENNRSLVGIFDTLLSSFEVMANQIGDKENGETEDTGVGEDSEGGTDKI